MRRRAFIASVGAAALSGLVKRAEAQALPGRTWRLGYLAFAKIPHLVEALQTGLRDLGYVEGRNIAVEYRFANDEPEALERFALELAQLAPDIILTVGTPATAAVKRVTSTIPIVVATAGNLVQTGIVQSIVRPGGNITGTTIYSLELGQKRLQILKETSSGVTRVAVLGNARNILTPLLWEDLHAAGRELGLNLRLASLKGAQELDSTFAAFEREGMEALVVLSDSVFNSNRDRITKLAAAHRLPTMYEAREFVQAGGLMSYGPDIAHMSYLAAGYVDKVLKGAKPGDLPIEQPSKFQFVINLRAARELGMEIPVVVLYRADEVIE